MYGLKERITERKEGVSCHKKEFSGENLERLGGTDIDSTREGIYGVKDEEAWGLGPNLLVKKAEKDTNATHILFMGTQITTHQGKLRSGGRKERVAEKWCCSALLSGNTGPAPKSEAMAVSQENHFPSGTRYRGKENLLESSTKNVKRGIATEESARAWPTTQVG